MAKYVFVNLPAYGHVNPTLAVVHELIERGEQVTYYNAEEFRDIIETTGAEFHSYDLAPLTTARTKETPLPIAAAAVTEEIARALIEPIRAEHADVLVYDPLCFWGRLIAQVLQIKAALTSPTYITSGRIRDMLTSTHPGEASQQTTTEENLSGSTRKGTQQPGIGIPAGLFTQVHSRLTQAYRHFNLPEQSTQQDFLQQDEGLIISFLPETFQSEHKYLDSRYYFAGPSITTRNDGEIPLERLSGKNVLYISLGTAFNNQVEFFNTCIAAFKDSPWQVVMAYGRRINPDELDPLPDNFIAQPHLPQLDILPYTDIFISHGGMNSTMESLYYGVPLIVIPQMIEQAITAQRIQELHLGIELLPQNVSVASLHLAVANIQNDTEIHEQVSNMQQEIRRLPGYRGAATKLIEYARSH